MTATFKAGEMVLFRRDWGDRWRLGAYVSLIEDAHHRVRDDSSHGLVYTVPSDRIKAPDYGRPIASNYDPHGTGR